MKIYEVGGCVRDEILGVPSKDIDFSFVFDEGDLVGVEDPFTFMVEWLKNLGFLVFKESPEYLTARAQFPGKGIEVEYTDGFYRPFDTGRYRGMTADFVLARKESDYTDGRRPDVVEPGTLEDDLSRRDFTVNAIAKDTDGSYIDPFGGRADIDARIIRAVGDPVERLTEDALRAVRALRFSVTKGFTIDISLSTAMQDNVVLDAIENKISDERIQQELSKMFRYDTLSSINILSQYGLLTDAMFAGSVSLDATMKTKGRNK